MSRTVIPWPKPGDGEIKVVYPESYREIHLVPTSAKPEAAPGEVEWSYELQSYAAYA
jgi:hypothetical protein